MTLPAKKHVAPKKRPGQARGRRRIDGKLILGIAEAAVLLCGSDSEKKSEKRIRSQVARGQLPYRRLGGRIVFLRAELERFLAALPGITVDAALANSGAGQEPQ